MATYEPSIVDVIKNAIRDAQDLMRSQVALARAEVREEVRRLSVGAGLLAGAAFAAVIAVIFLMTTVALAIADLFGWSAWMGFGIVTAFVALAAAALGYGG
jgi:ABC-type Fe3+-siderophore transport system permease subunit